MKTSDIDQRPSIRALSILAGRLALTVVCVIVMMSAARSQDTPQPEPAARSSPASGDQKTSGREAPPVDGLLDVRDQNASADQAVDGLVFTSPGQPTYVRDLRLSETSAACASTGRAP